MGDLYYLALGISVIILIVGAIVVFASMIVNAIKVYDVLGKINVEISNVAVYINSSNNRERNITLAFTIRNLSPFAIRIDSVSIELDPSKLESVKIPVPDIIIGTNETKIITVSGTASGSIVGDYTKILIKVRGDDNNYPDSRLGVKTYEIIAKLIINS